MSGGADILLVGGYGEVGRLTATELVRHAPGRVVVAGRNEASARAVADALGDVRSRRVDLDDPASVGAALAEASVVVSCVERPDVALAAACLHRGIDYVDVTASHRLMLAIEALQPVAERTGATAVLSVGLAPGVTNLLARAASEALDGPQRADIDILLGLGDTHGAAALDWTLDQAHRTYALRDGTRTRRVRPFAEPHRVVLSPLGSRTTFAFDFADQHVVTRTLRLESAQTRLCLDSVFVTWVFAALAAVGALRALRWNWLRALAVRVLRRLSFGSAAFVVRAQVEGERACTCAQVHGEAQARATAVVTAYVVERLMERSYPSGIHHIEQVVDPAAMFARLRDRGFVVSTPS